MDLGLVPYNFEPEYSEEELRDRAGDGEEEIEHYEDQECRCGRCQFQIVIVPEEKNCCTDNNLCIPNLADCTCITEHPSFNVIVLNRAVLEVAFVQILAYKGNQCVAPAILTNR